MSETNSIKAFRSSKGIVLQEVADHRSPHFMLRKRSLTRTIKIKNLKTTVGRSTKLKDLHYMLRKDNVEISSLADQRTIIDQLLSEDKISLGSTHYVISSAWFDDWTSYVAHAKKEDEEDDEDHESHDEHSNDLKKLRPIDNSKLMANGEDLRRDLSSKDYVLLPKEAWKKFMAWYGGGPAIPRPTVLHQNKLQIELYPLTLRVMKVATEDIKTFSFSESSTMKEVRRRIASALAVPLVKCTLFNFDEELTSEDNLEKTLKQLDCKHKQIIIMRNQDDKVVLSGRMMGITNVKPETTLVEKVLGKPVEQVSYPVKIKEGFALPTFEVIPSKKDPMMDELARIADQFVQSQSHCNPRPIPAANT